MNSIAKTRNISLIFVLLLFGIHTAHSQNCYELVWSDEFNYQGLPDPSIWKFEEGGTGWGNNELQYYTSDRLENARVEEGYLTIEARKENYGNRQYTSARLITYPSVSWQYGKIEARIKLPYGQGIWPAFWGLGNGIFEGTPWPGCGEIDIMEMVGGGDGKDNVVHGTIHYADINNNHAQYGGDYKLNQGIFADTFHVFSIEWSPLSIKWFVDGIQYHTASLTQNYLSELHEEFFLLLNLAVGGNWPGSPNASTVFPQKMMVDYVRVYQNNAIPEISGDTLTSRLQKNLNFKTVESPGFSYTWTVPEDAVITEGQGTSNINVTWGCSPGEVICEMITNCQEYRLSLPVTLTNTKISGNTSLQAFTQDNFFSVPDLDSTKYVWSIPDYAHINGNSDTSRINVYWTREEDYLKIDITNACGNETDSIFITPVTQIPYNGENAPHIIPGIIEAYQYDLGGEGIAYHDQDTENKGPGIRQEEGVDTEPNDGGYNIGWIEAGEWVEYTIQTESSGFYDALLRVASQNGGGQMEILFNEENRGGLITIPKTNSWTSFTSLTLDNIQLYDSDTIMRLNFISGEFNISRLAFNNAATSVNTTLASNRIVLFPNPADELLHINGLNTRSGFSVYTISGKKILSGYLNPEAPLNINILSAGIYFLEISDGLEKLYLKFIRQ